MSKNICFLGFAWFLFLMAVPVHAGNITQQQAKTAAQKAMKHYVAGFDREVADAESIVQDGQTVCHIFNFKPEGWVIVSADDAVTPVLGYSATGLLHAADMGDNMRSWMQSYGDDICRYVITGQNKERHSGWQAIEVPAMETRASTDKVSELISVKWDQSRPFNVYCPGGNTYVGCVAVAMAQAMSVAQYPPRPVGSFAYNHDTYGTISVNYDAEPAYNWKDIMSGANNYDDVARLLYHCGVSVKMDYTTSGSGAMTAAVATALVRNFQYPSSVTYYSRSGYTGDWKALLINELQSGRAVVYCGYPASGGTGHCFNLDGYDGNNMFHVNWGWRGGGNGYFTLDGLKDAHQNLDYTNGHGMVVGVRAPTEAPTDIFLDNTAVGENLPAGTVVGKLSVSSEASNPVYSFSVVGPYSPILHRRTAAPFDVQGGNLVTKEVLSRSKSESYDIEITVTNLNNSKSYTKSFKISVVDATAINAVESDANRLRQGVYDINGRRINAPVKGLNIINGRKVIVK